jgi:hypothetical protein
LDRPLLRWWLLSLILDCPLLRRWLLSLILDRPLLRLRRLPLILDCRASLLSRRRGLGWGCPLNGFDCPLRRLCALGGWSALLQRRWRIGTLAILLPGTSLLRRSLRSLLRSRGRSLHCLLLEVLLHYGVTRLVTIILAVKRLLLLRPGIPIP